MAKMDIHGNAILDEPRKYLEQPNIGVSGEKEEEKSPLPENVEMCPEESIERLKKSIAKKGNVSEDSKVIEDQEELKSTLNNAQKNIKPTHILLRQI